MTRLEIKFCQLTRGCMLLLFLVCLAAPGCTGSNSTAGGEDGHDHDHDHGGRPASYAAAIDQIRHARDEVKAAFDAGTPHACDDALHEVAEVLDILPVVAAETDLPKEEWQVVKDQSKALFGHFMKIHDGFHGESSKGVSFDSVGSDIDEVIEVLASKIALTGEKVSQSGHEGHDHDGHEHDGHEHDHDEHDHDEHGHDEHGHDHEGEHDHDEHDHDEH